MYSPTLWRRFLPPFSLWSNKSKVAQKWRLVRHWLSLIVFTVTYLVYPNCISADPYSICVIWDVSHILWSHVHPYHFVSSLFIRLGFAPKTPASCIPSPLPLAHWSHFVSTSCVILFPPRNLTHCGRVTQICIFNTVKLGTSALSP
jgi:hypothetical protein